MPSRLVSTAPPRRRIAPYLLDKLSVLIARVAFGGSASYWELRYRMRGSSGAGSYGAQARFKAHFLNRFIADNGIADVVDFGCGDGAQIGLLAPVAYLGVDVSDTAVEICRQRFELDPNKRFSSAAQYQGERADLSMSLDVVFHLVEDEVFTAYMDRLFAAARKFVVIYSTNHAETVSTHVRHRELTGYCAARYAEFVFVAESSPVAGATFSAPRFLVFNRK